MSPRGAWEGASVLGRLPPKSAASQFESRGPDDDAHPPVQEFRFLGLELVSFCPLVNIKELVLDLSHHSSNYTSSDKILLI